ncbi:hypothetical protein CDAR_89261 [Caerostris darwini]|uniref:Uncharacterized protein n=1 Tax=Caerostris darwini TaxID=1538125 RepID=A0AAV4UHA4_9ARAC|nr:hypothetical protein CDAR_89261 [Caerostris darwini]
MGAPSQQKLPLSARVTKLKSQILSDTGAMDYIREFDIRLEKEMYYAGEVLSGHVILDTVENFKLKECDKRAALVSLLLPISGYSFLLKNVLWAAGREIHQFSFRPGIRPLVFFPFLLYQKGLKQIPPPSLLPSFCPEKFDIEDRGKILEEKSIKCMI